MTGVREEDLVRAIAALLRSGPRRILVGIGDDAAVWQPSRSHRSIITSDASVDGVHFSDVTMSRYDAGWRSMAANLSDAAAMGARPVLATVALGIAPDESLERVLELYRGIADCAHAGGASIVGGDLTQAPATTIAITLVGEVRPSNLKTRSGGRSGDVVVVSGALGASRAGLYIALGHVSIDDEAVRDAALLAHRHPQARLAEARFLAASAHVHAMMDCSDGLATDLPRLADASGCAAVIERVPVADAARAAALGLGEDPAQFALAGGEEYELIVAVSRTAVRHLSERFAARFGRPLEIVGRLREGSGCSWRNGEREEPLPRSGWDHFER